MIMGVPVFFGIHKMFSCVNGNLFFVSSGQQRCHCGGSAVICQRAGGSDRPHGKPTVLKTLALMKHFK